MVATALMPRVLDSDSAVTMTILFLFGGGVSLLLARLVSHLQSGRASAGSTAAWMVMAAVAIDLAVDGLMTGAGSAVDSRLGLILGISQIFGNMPGGFAAIANFRMQGLPRTRRFVMIGMVPLPPVVGALIGFLALRSAGDVVQSGAIALMVGVLLLATVEDTVPEGDKPQPPRRYSSLSFALGFAFMLVLNAFA